MAGQELLERIDENDYKPRDYQEQLLNRALQENVIIYLPTGAGKTYIALMAMKAMSQTLQGTLAEGGKRSAFLCNTVALAKQQFEVIRKFHSLKVRIYTGDMNVDNWKREKWEIEFDQYQVFVATTQIILDCVRHNFIKIEDFNLLIFDECHHASKEHPMHQLMRLFQVANQNKLPRVIGLTGLLIKNSTAQTFLQDLNSLEAVFRSKIITVENFNEFKNVLVYSTKPKEFLKYYDDNSSNELVIQIETIINECVDKVLRWKIDESHVTYTKNLGNVKAPNPIKRTVNLLKDFLYQMNDMGIYGASIAILGVIVEFELKKRAAETDILRKMYRFLITYMDRIRHIIANYLYDLDDDEIEPEHEIILSNSSSKVVALFEQLLKYFKNKNKNDIKCLLFVNRRHTAKNLYHVIKQYVKSDSSLPIVPDFMIGHNSGLPESIESILEEKWGRNVIDHFKKNECNLIVASSVLEEGIDVQSCNYVFVYDDLLGFRQYVQTKGRARKDESTYLMFVSNSNKEKLIKNIISYKKMDEDLKHYLIGKTIDRALPMPEEIDQQFKVIIEPFISPIGARLEAESAITLLNRYCMQLPNDCFTATLPKWSKEELPMGKVRVKLVLPMQSTIKEEVWSDVMDNVKWAKRSAAFKACLKLYENKEFNNNLLPTTKKKCLELISPTYFNHWLQFSNDNFLAGTQKNRRLHQIQYPSELNGSLPKIKNISYLYKILFCPKFVRDSDKSTEHLFDLFLNPGTFGILLSKKIPKLAKMSLFMSQGEVLVEISSDPIEVEINSQEDLIYIRNFHIMIFKDLLEFTWQSYYAQSYNNEENSYLITPLTAENQINYNLIKNFQNLPNIAPVDDLKRRKIKLNKENFLNNIVATWYTVDDKTRYIVKAIRDDMNPLSKFPNSQYKNYADYFEDKYSVKVQQNSQFLIEVQPITSRKNFLLYSEGSKRKSKKFDTIILIPELCHNFNFPSHLWLKARFLPTILHRFNYLLIAESIRCEFNKHLNFSDNNYSPQTLSIDRTLAKLLLVEEYNINEMSTPQLPNLAKQRGNTVSDVDNAIFEASVKRHNFKWPVYVEPIDVSRHFDNAFKLDIEYYAFFKEYYNNQSRVDDDLLLQEQFQPINIITEKLKNVDLNMDCSENVQNQNLQAIEDISNRQTINLLNITKLSVKSPEQSEILAAITAKGSNDVFNMERLELLGDSFLKFSISLFLLKEHPTWNEGFLTSVKGQFVSNKNLLYHSILLNIPGALKSHEFKADEWYPPLVSVPKNLELLVKQNNISETVFTELNLDDDEIFSGECNDVANFQKHFPNHDIQRETIMSYLMNNIWISDKVCADAIEALLGVCIKNYGIKNSFAMLQYFEIVSKDFDLKNLLDLNLGNPRLRTNIPDKEVDSFLLNYRKLEENLKYTFKDRAYLLQALTHPSYPTNRITGCYQQLEFIGDAILDFLVTAYIFERCSKMDPGKLTDLRSALVNNVTLACIAIRNKFHLFILFQNALLSQSIMKFVEFQKEQDYNVNDQVRILLLESESNDSMADYVDVPKTLGDIFEAIIGAVFLDSGNDLEITWNVIYHLIQHELNEFMVNVPIQPVRRLQETKGVEPKYTEPIADGDIVMLKCQFTCRNELREVSGFGRNRIQAKISAAKMALQVLERA